MRSTLSSAFLLLLALVVVAGCASPGRRAYERRGDEIMVAGQLFHTGAPVVLWTDPGGYDAYRVERRFVPFDQSGWDTSKEKLETPNRYNLRHRGDWPAPLLEDIRGGGWDLPLLQRTVDQFVLHYDASGTSRQCFNILHDHRGLSVHFMLDLDGTIYQTLDVKERAWHAGPANDRAIGIEIANIGAYPHADTAELDAWYAHDEDNGPYVKLPEKLGDGGIRTPGFVARPARDQPVVGSVNGQELVQYDFTPQQYRSLIRLTRALCRIFPNLQPEFPRNDDGTLILDRPLNEQELAAFRGILGHHHVTENKVDPGPAFDWERLERGIR